MRTQTCGLLAITIAFGLSACTRTDTPTSNTSEQTQTQNAMSPSQLMDEYFEAFLQLSPGDGINYGDFRFNDRYSRIDEKTMMAKKQLVQKTLSRLQAIDSSHLDEQERISYDWLKFDMETMLQGFNFPNEMIPFNQFYNELNTFAQLGSGTAAQPFASVADYDNFLKKIDGFVANVDNDIHFMQQGMTKGVVLPKILAERMLPQFQAQIVNDADASVFFTPLNNFPDSIPEPERQRLRSEYRATILHKLVPAYRKMHDFVEHEYLPKCRSTTGMADLPDGKAWYAFMIMQNTTISDMSADQIHDLGVHEVERIHQDMAKIQLQLGIKGDLSALFAHMKTDPSMYFTSAQDTLKAYRDIKQRIADKLPALFAVMPKNDYEIREVEAFRAESMSSAEYIPGSPDGSRLGIFYVNTHDLHLQPRYGVTTLSLHEAAPGHHFQISLAMETQGLPKYRQFGGNNAYVEGWALYAESLGYEMGLYEDPIQRYGTLSDELLRAMRLVVDTGLHAQGWTREQAIDYMKANSSVPDTDIVSEVERYMALPGQALSYKLGQIRIRQLRTEAEAALAERFDVKAFHREVLSVGAVPMSVLQSHIHRWMESLKTVQQ